MSKEVWFISDTHFGHKNIINFVDGNYQRTRPFSSTEEMDELMVENWNSLVKDGDRVYHLGDVCMSNKNLPILKRLKGRKCLIKGNHDIFKLKEYLPYFDDIRAYRIYSEHGIICSHIPVHTQQLNNRFRVNVHGHLHTNTVYNLSGYRDPRYINVCVEQTGYFPVNLNTILKEVKRVL